MGNLNTDVRMDELSQQKRGSELSNEEVLRQKEQKEKRLHKSRSRRHREEPWCCKGGERKC